MAGRLTGEVAVVTGGGGVLCSAMSKALAAEGAKVAVMDLRRDAADKVADEIKSAGGEAAGVECNVLERASLDEARATVRDAFGPCSIIVNGAGGNSKDATTGPDLSFFDIPAEALKFVMNLNFLGTFLPCQVFGKDLTEAGEGVIVNIASTNAILPLTKIPGYSAAKAAVANFTQWLAVHMCQNYSKKIRVNAIAPGFFLTAQNRFLLTDEKTGELTPRGRQIIEHTPAGRFGGPEELLGALKWLVSDEAAFVTGIVLPVDGGFAAYSGV